MPTMKHSPSIRDSLIHWADKVSRDNVSAADNYGWPASFAHPSRLGHIYDSFCQSANIIRGARYQTRTHAHMQPGNLINGLIVTNFRGR